MTTITKLKAALAALEKSANYMKCTEAVFSQGRMYLDMTMMPSLSKASDQSITDLRSVIAEMEAGEPVARLLTWKGRGTYPEKGYTIARTFGECAENGYPKDWDEGAKLYTHPHPKAEPVQEPTDWRTPILDAIDKRCKAAQPKAELLSRCATPETCPDHAHEVYPQPKAEPQGWESVNGLALAAIGREHFGNPIPKAWYAAAKALLEYTHPQPKAEPVQEPHKGCACRWDADDNRVATCERHQGWLDVVQEWADRARAAEAATLESKT